MSSSSHCYPVGPGTATVPEHLVPHILAAQAQELELKEAG